MLINLLMGLSTMVLCLVLQVLLIVGAYRYYVAHRNLTNSPSLWRNMRLLSIVMLLLVIGNLGQIGIWALLFRILGEFQQFNPAFYHSAVNFASLGYGDIVMSDRHKLLGALEALNGVLMVGVSTAVLIGPFKGVLQKATER